MTTLFDSARVVKPRTFGRGVLRSVPAYRETHSAADEAEYVAERLRRENAALEQMAGAWEAQQWVDAGLPVW